MRVLKFGGAATGSIEGLSNMARIVSSGNCDVIVVTALSGVTDELRAAARAAESGTPYEEDIEALRTRHLDALRAFQADGVRDDSASEVESDIAALKTLLSGIVTVGELSGRVLDRILSYGESLALTVTAAVLRSRGLDVEVASGESLILTDSRFGSARCLDKETRERVAGNYGQLAKPLLVSGFVGSTPDGVVTTLGKGGGDYTATILGSALRAEEIEIWSDVDGMFTAEPGLVSDAFVIDEISYEEALEMSHFGDRVLHPAALLPAMRAGIPVRVRNIHTPDAPGTRITRRASKSPYPVRGLASIPEVALLTLKGLGMPGVTGIAGRMFGALASADVNAIMITQASSELSITCVVDPESAARGAAALRKEFSQEISSGAIGGPSVEEGKSVLAVVGERMKHKTGISGRVFSALGRNGVNVFAIAQGSSELNISIVVASKDRAKALNVIHDAFFLAGIRTVNLFLAGTGLIGGTLLAQIAKQKQKLLAEHSIRINIVGIANSRSMLIDPEGIEAALWKERMAGALSADLAKFVAAAKELNLPSACFCDCTASDMLPDYYKGLFESSISIVTPNKRANSGPLERFRALKAAALEKDVVYGYETTVGAGLPVIGTLKDLVACGDGIQRIEAVLSGTVSYLFNELGKGGNFSSLVLEAKRLGYTEPDPRDDLGAVDIARKTLILIREAGFSLDYGDISIQPLIPADLAKAGSVQEFLDRLPELDESFRKMVDGAASRGKVLRYVALIEPGKAALTLKEYGPESPFYNLAGTDNIVLFSTERYSRNPLVVRGPGAGADVTAGGVFADILKTAQSYL